MLVDKLGRRFLLLGSVATMGVSLFIIAICDIAERDGAGTMFFFIFISEYLVKS